jgi:hypothetical protein
LWSDFVANFSFTSTIYEPLTATRRTARVPAATSAKQLSRMMISVGILPTVLDALIWIKDGQGGA